MTPRRHAYKRPVAVYWRGGWLSLESTPPTDYRRVAGFGTSDVDGDGNSNFAQKTPQVVAFKQRRGE